MMKNIKEWDMVERYQKKKLDLFLVFFPKFHLTVQNAKAQIWTEYKWSAAQTANQAIKLLKH